MQPRLVALLSVLICSLFLALPAVANEDSDKQSQLSDTKYLVLEPAFVTNYGGPGRLKYVKAHITLMVDGEEHKLLLDQQKPLVRNVITMNLSRQTERNVTTSAGQERIRLQLLQDINGALKKEIGGGIVEEVLFTNFIYQN